MGDKKDRVKDPPIIFLLPFILLGLYLAFFIFDHYLPDQRFDEELRIVKGVVVRKQFDHLPYQQKEDDEEEMRYKSFFHLDIQTDRGDVVTLTTGNVDLYTFFRCGDYYDLDIYLEDQPPLHENILESTKDFFKMTANKVKNLLKKANLEKILDKGKDLLRPES